MARPLIFFGASFNPPTLAHRAIVDYLLAAYPGSLIMLAPVYQHRFNAKSELVDFKDRLEMTRLAFPELTVSEIEKTVHELHPEDADLGTVDVLEYMKAHPEDFEGDVNHISLVLGADTFNDFFSGKWKNAEHILELVDAIHAFERKGLTLVPSDSPKVKLELGAIQDPKIQVLSSTRIREDENFARAGVHPKVFDYMMRHHLYC